MLDSLLKYLQTDAANVSHGTEPRMNLPIRIGTEKLVTLVTGEPKDHPCPKEFEIACWQFIQKQILLKILCV